MTQPKSKAAAPAVRSGSMMVGNLTLDELRTQHRERVETNRRVEELKVSLFHITEHSMDQAVRIIRRWLKS